MKSSPKRLDDELMKDRARLHGEALACIKRIKKTLTAVESALTLESPVFPVYVVDARDAMSDLLYFCAQDAALWKCLNRELFRTHEKGPKTKARRKR